MGDGVFDRRFPRRMRLGGQSQFRAVYSARTSVQRGPLVVYIRGNDLDHARIGVSISRRVGGAVVRNRIRRRLREAFRHLGDLREQGYDLVINVRPHELLPQDTYHRHLAGAIEMLQHRWKQQATKARRNAKPDA